MLDRRRFLIGAGALLTASFVNKATAFSRTAGEPLILPLTRRPEETLYIYRTGLERLRDKTTLLNGACRSARTSHSRRRLHLAASTCAASGIASTRTTISIAPASK